MNHWFDTGFNTYHKGKTFMHLVSESNIAHTILYSGWANWLPIMCIAFDRDRKGATLATYAITLGVHTMFYKPSLQT